MKRSKRMLLLVLVLAVVCTAAFAATKYEEKQEEIQAREEVILELPSEDVETVAWEHGSGGLSFHREDDGWQYDEDAAFPVSGEKMSEILSHFEAFGASFIIENVEDYGQYGLDEPECTIALTTEETSYEIRLGAFSRMDEQRYVDIGDGNVYLVSDDPMDYLSEELSGMIQNDTTPQLKVADEIRFSGAEDYAIVYAADSTDSYSAEDVYFTERDGRMQPLDTQLVDDYLETVSSLSFDTYVTYHADAEELADYGLDEPELSVTIAYTQTDEDENEQSETCILHIGRNQEEQEKAEQAAENGEDLPAVTKYVRVGDSGIVYELDDASYSTLAAAAYDDLRHDEVIWAKQEQITQIEVSLEGETHTITAEPSDEKGSAEKDTSDTESEDTDDRVWYCDGEEMEPESLMQAIEGLEALHFTKMEAEKKEEIRLTVHLDNENFPEIGIVLYRYDGEKCLAVVDGESVSFVARSAVMELVETVQSLVLNE